MSSRLVFAIAVFAWCSSGGEEQPSKPGETDWRVLFDGRNATQWAGGNGITLEEAGWKVEDGCLRTAARNADSIYTPLPFDNFDLEFEWRILPGGNSGVKYFCVPGRVAPFFRGRVVRQTAVAVSFGAAALLLALLASRRIGAFTRVWFRRSGFLASVLLLALSVSGWVPLYRDYRRNIGNLLGVEFQIIDDDGYSFRLKPEQKTGAVYGLVAPFTKEAPKLGEFHQGRIVVAANHVEHWVDGNKTAAYELGSTQFRDAVARSKFSEIPGFAEKPAGSLIQLQGHGSPAWFRILRIRPLAPKMVPLPAR